VLRNSQKVVKKTIQMGLQGATFKPIGKGVKPLQEFQKLRFGVVL